MYWCSIHVIFVGKVYLHASMFARVAAFSPLANSPPAISPEANGPPAKSPPPAAIRPPLAYNSMSITFLLIH